MIPEENFKKYLKIKFSKYKKVGIIWRNFHRRKFALEKFSTINSVLFS